MDWRAVKQTTRIIALGLIFVGVVGSLTVLLLQWSPRVTFWTFIVLGLIWSWYYIYTDIVHENLKALHKKHLGG